MNINLEHRPTATIARISLQPGETVTTEAGSMVAMSSHLKIETSAYRRSGSLWGSIKRVIGGESFFLNHYSASRAGEILLTSSLMGDMEVIEVGDQPFILQAGSFVACEPTISIDVGWQGFKNLLSGESLFWLKLSGRGRVLVSTFGAIYQAPESDGYVVDTGHIVGFDASTNFTITKAGRSWLSSFLGGEGFVCKFKGPGKIYCQSHNLHSFGSSLTRHLLSRKT